MSCAISLRTTLICSTNLLPEQEMLEVLNLCLEELKLVIVKNKLIKNGKEIASIKISDKIVATSFTEVPEVNELRKLFTKKSEIAQKNYIDELEAEKNRLSKENKILDELERKINNIDEKIEICSKAKAVQSKSNCEALKTELSEIAKLTGYDIIEQKTDSGVELQFIKISY